MKNDSTVEQEQEGCVRIPHKRWLILYRMVMRIIMALLIGLMILVTIREGRPNLVLGVVLIVLINRIRKDWAKWKGKEVALVLYPEYIKLSLFNYRIGRLLWSEVEAVESVKRWGTSKQLKIILKDSDAVIQREPRRLWRWMMYWTLRTQKTPFVWSSAMLEHSHQEQYDLLNDYHQGQQDFSSLSQHLIDNSL